jgi:phosphoribosylformylglycinamidine synthase
VDLLSARARYRTLHQAIRAGLVSACHDLSDGGLGVALAEMCIGGELGADLDLDAVVVSEPDLPAEVVLYSESPSRLLVTVPQGSSQAFERLFQGQTLARVGRVRAEPSFVVRSRGGILIQEDVQELERAWASTFASF